MTRRTTKVMMSTPTQSEDLDAADRPTDEGVEVGKPVDTLQCNRVEEEESGLLIENQKRSVMLTRSLSAEQTRTIMTQRPFLMILSLSQLDRMTDTLPQPVLVDTSNNAVDSVVNEVNAVVREDSAASEEWEANVDAEVRASQLSDSKSSSQEIRKDAPGASANNVDDSSNSKKDHNETTR